MLDFIIPESMMAKAFLFFLLTKTLVEAYLEARNKKHVLVNSKQVPAGFENSITLEEHQKAASYTVAKIKMSSFFQFIDLAILLIWIFGGALNSLDIFARSLSDNSIAQGLIFFGLFILINTLLSLPQSIYKTFVLEERFGFNKTTPKIFIVDMVKGLVLGAIIGLPILAGILWIMQGLGDYWWVVAWAFLMAIQFILIWAYPVLIAPLFNKFVPLEEGEVKDKVINLLHRTGFESKGLFVMNASLRSAHGNAYFTGFGKNKRIVFFDTLIKTLNAGEVEAVLAHELGHFKKKHILKMLIKATIFSLIGFGILGFLKDMPTFYQAHGIQEMSNHSALVLFMLVSGVYTFFLTPFSSKSSRKNEYEADAFAAENSEAKDLMTALVKLTKDNASTLTPDPMYSRFYYSHPPTTERLKFLQAISAK